MGTSKSTPELRPEEFKRIGVTSILKPPKDTRCDMDLEEEDLNTISIFSAAKSFKQQQNNLNQEKSQKSVRFLNATPKLKGKNEDNINEEMELEEPEETTINVNIGGFAFNECGMLKNP